MQKSTIENLRSLAPDLLVGKYPKPIPAYAQHAVAILKILQDGQWHTAREIGEELGISKKYCGDVLRACKDSWGLTSNNPKGWMLQNERQNSQRY